MVILGCCGVIEGVVKENPSIIPALLGCLDCNVSKYRHWSSCFGGPIHVRILGPHITMTWVSRLGSENPGPLGDTEATVSRGSYSPRRVVRSFLVARRLLYSRCVPRKRNSVCTAQSCTILVTDCWMEELLRNVAHFRVLEFYSMLDVGQCPPHF